MLYQLSIQNIALIDRLTIEFDKGLNILSGETGAGKSIIVDAVNLLLGGRADRDLIKTGEDKAIVEGIFDIRDNLRIRDLLLELGIMDEGEENTLILSRELSVNGKNICRVNGRLMTVAVLRQISNMLVDIHGQHEHQSLLNTEEHIHFLDKFGGDELLPYLHRVSDSYRKWKDVSSRLHQRFGNERERERRMDMLKFQIAEIKQAHLKKGEEEDLLRQRDLLINSEKIAHAVNHAYESVYTGDGNSSSMLDSLGKVLSELSEVSHLDSFLTDLHKHLNDVYYSLEDIAFGIRDARNQYEYDPRILDDIESRLDAINILKRKYGKSIEEILQFQKEAESELEELINNAEIIKKLEKEKAECQNELYRNSTSLSEYRKKIAIQFEEKMMEQLKDLGLGKSKFKVQILSSVESSSQKNKEMFTDKGFDQVEFLISTNPGEPLKPLAKIVSGGEMSRIMLALKNIAAHIDEIPCLIFDEIDTGISGQMAQIVAEKLVSISLHHQVICVTHLPQIASMADRHYLIEKLQQNNSTRTTVRRLQEKERFYEIARLAGGIAIGELGIEHAKEMVKFAQSYKRKVN